MHEYDHKAIRKKWPQSTSPAKAVRGAQISESVSKPVQLPDYDHRLIESKWQKIWEKTHANVASDNPQKKKYYCLIEFPYPSGEGLHVGHVRSNTAMDIIARKRRAEGFNVLYPIGWDAFGLPTENYAVKTGIHPSEVTKQNSDNFRRQLKSMGFSFDWSREINTSDPAYYKWTQWIFLKFLERGLAYKKRMVINWCPKDKTGLANEEVIDGNCERCGTPVEKREKEQWMLAITKYADRLDKDLDTVNYLPEIKTQQRNWIGKSTGTELNFRIQSENPKRFPKKILIGTRNEAKVRMFREAFQAIAVELVTLNDVVPIDDSKLVEGDDCRENARLKSKFYFEKTGIPTISTDQIQWVEKFPHNKGFVVHARKLANPESPRATDEEVGQWIEKLVDDHGESNATFYYAISYTDNNGTKDFVNIQREYTLQKEKSPKKNDGYVFDRYMKDKETGKFRIEQPFKVAFSKFDEFIHNEFLFSFGSEEKVNVFTTRADTLFGATYLVFAPEHRLVQSWKKEITNWPEVEKYIENTKKKSEIERTSEGKEKTGVELKGIKAINPATGKAIPVFVADYVLIDYGTGAIMAVPAHDERDFEFAAKYKLPIQEVIEPLIVRSEGEDSIRQNIPFTERHAVVCIIKHWSEDKYLGLRWKKNGWQGFVIGGVEKGETPEAAGIREIIEETGYKHPIFKGKLGGMVHSKFYQVVKNENRFAHFEPLFYTLKDGARKDVSDNEKTLHDLCWLSEKELLSFVNREDMKIIASRISDGNVYTGEGILVNSNRFNGFYNRDAIKAITEYVAGKPVVKYKLRDWIFSRQRYWGEPIPVIHCDHCREQKQKVLIIHGFEAKGSWNWIPWMKRELEAQGFEVITPTMSTAKHPDLKTWMKELVPHMRNFGPNDIVIGHSLGSKAALHLLLECKKEIGSLLLIASAIGELQERDWQRMKERWIGSDIEALKKFWLVPIDLKKISKYARKVSIVISKDDTSVPMHTHERLPKEWNFEMWNGFKHFTKAEIPELLTWVLRAKSSGIVPVPEKDLPVELPNVKEFKPRDDGESPLASAKKWVEVKCPHCGKTARRETDTMPNWAGSSWYYLRYIDPANKHEFASSSKLSYWLPVDWYNGGMEHTTLHLLYSRFWHKFLFDLKLVPTNEPYQKRTAHGMILAEGGVKMSKSKGNVINPDTIVETVGADTLRVYEMFLGPFDQSIAWDPSSIAGSRRFLEKIWRLQSKVSSANKDANRSIETLLNQTIKKVGDDIENIRFNTAVSQLMILTNAFEKKKEISKEDYQTIVRLVAPFAPHIAEELWEIMGKKTSVHDEPWPAYDVSKLSSEIAKIVVQINGKVRGTVEIVAGAIQSEVEAKVRSDKTFLKWLGSKETKRVFFVPNRLINFVIEEKI